jgi:hypothetical protein
MFVDPDGLKVAGYGGWEAQFIGGYGEMTVTCCDGEKLRKHKYRKVCFGAGFIAGVSSGGAGNSQGASCKNPPKILLTPELGFGVGPIGAECGIGFNNQGASVGCGGSAGAGFKATVCVYWLVDSKEVGCCGD